MNLLLDRLRSYLPGLDCPPEELARRLTLAGVAVERVITGDDGATLLETDITSNRPDLLCYVGVAREAAALLGLALAPPTAPLYEDSESAASAAAIAIEAPELCPRYSARVVRDVRSGPSPAWLRRTVEAAGLRSLGSLVDVTNFVLLELGQPIHGFDLSTLEDRRIVVRRARPGESLRTLDGVDRKLDPDDLVIADGRRPVALAGVMGGAETEMTDATRDVLIESAHFDPRAIRHTARRHALRTEASLRFERGADPEVTLRAAERAASLLVEVAGGRVLAGGLDARPGRPVRRRVRLRLARLQALLGVPVRASDALRILDALGFQPLPVEEGAIEVEVPSFRPDVEREVDLIEEVGRVYGYEGTPSRLPASELPPPGLTRGQQREQLLRELLRGAGYSQVVSMAMVEAEREARVVPPGVELLRIQNPLSERLAAMRATLTGGQLEAASHNLRHGAVQVALFEIGHVFAAQPGGAEPDERLRLGLLLAPASDDVGQALLDLKGALELLARTLGAGEIGVAATAAGAAGISLAGTGWGRLGAVPADALAACGLDPARVVVFAEVELEPLLAAAPEAVRYDEVSRFPSTERDVSLFTAAPYGEVLAIVRGASPPWLEEVRLLDRFVAGDGRVSLTLRLTYRNPERTLSAEEANDAHGRVLAALAADTRLALRV